MTLRRLLFLIPVLVFAGIGIGLALGLTRDPSILPSALIGKSVPAFDLPPVAGLDRPGLSSADLEGQVVLVNVFASWCVPCRAEHPLLMRLADQGVAIYGINYKDKPGQVDAWLGELGDPFRRIGADQTGRVAIDWGVYGVPETFVIDSKGRIRYKFVGPLMPQDLDQTLLPMLAQLNG
jgi:cytochrome c biogenesis protein CcmG/thiol:disulfide interchange protein DsbE